MNLVSLTLSNLLLLCDLQKQSDLFYFLDIEVGSTSFCNVSYY